MPEPGLRARRVAEAIRAYVTRALAREVSDRRLEGVIVTQVEVPDDLGFARVWVRRLDDPGVSERGALIATLERAAGRLRRGLGPAVGLKRTPALRFEYDAGPDAMRRVEELLQEIEREKDGNRDE
jgi:ribosome-binding factor A